VSTQHEGGTTLPAIRCRSERAPSSRCWVEAEDLTLTFFSAHDV
jgi:hypothetical protein